ncbi:hypothetical protein SH611_19910 [Geminicoccaceae bacterium 1502E]|nr:hypothetical protein [Geminicoccaceae bacterium 1502E]
MEKAFTKGRYSYELNAEASIREVERIGREWVENGALLAEAQLAYYPMERDNVFHGLISWMEAETGLRVDLDE